MRYIIVLFIILIAAMWLGLWISEDSGYVLISYNHWTIQTSLWIGLAILLISFFILYTLLRLIAKTWGLPERFQRWKRMRNYKKARVLTNVGLCQLAEGYWTSAEKTLIQAAQLTKYPLIDYLAASRAASAQHNYEKRDAYLRLAAQSTKGSEIAVGLTQAQLQIQCEQWEQALATLKHLHQLAPQHAHILKLLQDVYVQLNEWGALKSILPSLVKYKAIKEKKCIELYEKVYLFELMQEGKKTTEALQAYWDDLPRKWQHNPRLQQAYAKALLRSHQDQLAVHFIEKALKHAWNKDLVQLYGQARGESPAKQLKTAEHWHKKHLTDPTLLLCLGSLCVHEKFWGKAVEYLEKSIAAQPCTEAYHALGQTYEALGQEIEALKYYRKGLQFSIEQS